jgi:hypothetical protein
MVRPDVSAVGLTQPPIRGRAAWPPTAFIA